MLFRFKHSNIITVLFSSLLCVGLTTSIQSAPSQAQVENPDLEDVEDELLDEVLSLQADVLTAIREAPFSELFTVTMEDGSTGYGVKDKDFDPSFDGVGFYSLWGKVPDRDVLEVAVFYCFLTPGLMDAELEAVVLMDGDTSLVTLEQEVITTQAQAVEVAPERRETVPSADPFYDPTWGSVYYGGHADFGEIVYLPAVNCQVGGGRFDLLPLQNAIAQLPSKTLNVQLRFSNGLIETWRLGQSTVEQIKLLPTL